MFYVFFIHSFQHFILIIQDIYIYIVYDYTNNKGLNLFSKNSCFYLTPLLLVGLEVVKVDDLWYYCFNNKVWLKVGGLIPEKKPSFFLMSEVL